MARQSPTDRTTDRTTARAKAPRAVAKPQATASAAEDHCRQWRAPQHERGRRRVDAILDAASAILREGGLEALSVDAVAKRSETSKSSMYHFFPDRDAIVRALAERHAAQLQAHTGFAPSEAVDWARLSVEETVDHFLEPFQRYSAEHPDVIPCMRAAAQQAGVAGSSVVAVLDALALERAERVIAARAPRAKPAERRARAATIFAVTVGALEVMARLGNAAPRAALMRELRRVLIGYLA